ncbi:helix-turn-helix domain-containing protein [Eubacteriales bacterium OttesenSCG-928-N13]|nr:helix-turn-helix domain-containing protein [Eubacteriales bacterium OttesenSCG-928-N13]
MNEHKLMIADDNALSIQGLLANVDFAALGIDVCGTYLNSMELLKALEAHDDVDLIVSDIRMPHMTGLEMAHEALSVRADIKIILISAYDDFEYAQEALRIGVYDYIQKPINYRYMTDVLRNACKEIDEQRRLIQQLSRTRPELTAKFYSDILHMYPTLAETLLSDKMEYLGIEAARGPHVCVAITSDARESMIGSLGVERYMLMTMQMQKNIEQVFSRHMHCQMLMERDMLVALLNKPDAEPGLFVSEIGQRLQQLSATKASELLQPCFGIGQPVASIWSLSHSLDTAMQALNLRFIFSDKNLFVSEVPQEASLVPFASLLETKERMILCISKRDEAALRALTQEILNGFAENQMDRLSAISYVHVMVSCLLSYFADKNIHLEPVYAQLFEFGNRPRQYQTSEQVVNELFQLCTAIMRALDASQQSHQERMVQRVKSYIEDRLGDPQLRLESIATAMHVNASHLSRLFKKLESCTISDHITHRRVERASQLLYNMEDSIAAVSERVGYASPYYFSACFKKVLGETPSEYRKRIQQ